MAVNIDNNGAEYVSILMLFMVLFLMMYTKPRFTPVYIIDLCGVALSFIEIILYFCIIKYVKYTQNFDEIKYNIMCVTFFAIYMILLILIFSYVALLSSKRLKMLPMITKSVIAAIIVYICTIAYILCNFKLYTVAETGKIQIAGVFKFYLVFGIIDVICCILVANINKNTFAKSIYTYIMVFSIFDAVLLIHQILLAQMVFSSPSFVFPFCIFYVLIHSNPFDEVSGFQNYYSFETVFLRDIKRREKNMIVYIEIPVLSDDRHDYPLTNIEFIIAQRSRMVSDISRKITVYAVRRDLYAVVIKDDNEEACLKLVWKIKDALEKPVMISGNVYNIKYKMVGAFNDGFITSIQMLNSMKNYMFSQFERKGFNNYYICNAQDHDIFARKYMIEKELLDIRKCFDLEDRRILCYVQPIYDTKNKMFKHAEVLMRLKFDDNIICPAQFIKAAENKGCIHMLTLIILNKVCQYISEMDMMNDFEAFTINCSPKEFAEMNFCRDVLEIIDNNKVDHSKIKFEITEDVMLEDFNMLLKNMNELKEAGIDICLDNFGIGYSNLEQIVMCPFEVVNFDKGILYKSVKDESVREFISGMTGLLKNKGLKLRIGGVENEEQNAFCMENGFDYIQGYYYAKPVPIEELTEFFTK